MNIIEKLITKKPNFDGIYNDVFRQMVRTELFIADNVMDYYWETDKDWTTKNIPNVAPPFRDFFTVKLRLCL